MSTAAIDSFALTDQQITYFRTFGYLRFPGLFRNEIDRLTEGFEDVFSDETNDRMAYEAPLHANKQRVNMMSILDRTPKMAWLKDDPRVHTIARTLAGDAYEPCGSDGSLFYCETSWHPDDFGAPLDQQHVKLSFYLDELGGDTGAIRVMPGTNHWTDRYAKFVRDHTRPPCDYQALFGAADKDLPSWPVPSSPGDVICWDYRTLHASFGGGERRRLFSVSFRDGSHTPA